MAVYLARQTNRKSSMRVEIRESGTNTAVSLPRGNRLPEELTTVDEAAHYSANRDR